MYTNKIVRLQAMDKRQFLLFICSSVLVGLHTLVGDGREDRTLAPIAPRECDGCSRHALTFDNADSGAFAWE